MAMLDIAYIRTNPDKVKLAAEQKLADADIDRLLALDSEAQASGFLGLYRVKQPEFYRFLIFV